MKIKTPHGDVTYAARSTEFPPGLDVSWYRARDGALIAWHVDAAALRWLAAEMIAEADRRDAAEREAAE